MLQGVGGLCHLFSAGHGKLCGGPSAAHPTPRLLHRPRHRAPAGAAARRPGGRPFRCRPGGRRVAAGPVPPPGGDTVLAAL